MVLLQAVVLYLWLICIVLVKSRHYWIVIIEHAIVITVVTHMMQEWPVKVRRTLCHCIKGVMWKIIFPLWHIIEYLHCCIIHDILLIGPCIDGSIRLGDDAVLKGRVEVCIGSTWYTICNHHWTKTEASVICSQLGYSPYG